MVFAWFAIPGETRGPREPITLALPVSGLSGAGGAVLGQVMADNGLVLDPAVQAFAIYLDTRRAVVTSPVCGTGREFRGSTVRRS